MESAGVESRGAEPAGVEPAGAESGGAEPRAAGAGDSAAGNTEAGGAGVTAGVGGTGGVVAAGPGGACTKGTGAARTGGVGGTGAGDPTEPGAAGAGGTGAGAGGAGAVDPRAGGAGGTVRPRPYFVPLLQQVLGVPSSTSLTPPLLCPPSDQSQLPLQPASPLPAPSPYTEQTGGLTERREPASRPASPVRTGRRVPRPRPPPVPGTHAMALRPSSVPLRIPLPPPPESSLPAVPESESDRARAASPAVSRLLAAVVTDPSFESNAASALVAELVDFAAAYHLYYATALVAESESASPPSVAVDCALGTDVLEDRQEDFECLAAAVPRFASMLLAPEGDPDAPDIPTPRSYAEAITGPYSSQWQAAMDAEMASWKSTGTYVNAVPPSQVNMVDGMWIFRVNRPPSSPPAFKVCYVAGRFSHRQGVDYFQTFSPTPKMTTLRVLHEEIWLRRPPGFTGSFPAGTQWSLRRPFYGLRQAPREWHDTLRTTLVALGFAPSTADPSLFLRTNTSLPLFYVLVYIDNLVFATAYTKALTLVLQRFGFQFSSPQPTPLYTGHSLSAPPSDKSIEPSGPYPELVGCLMYLMTCTRPDLAYPLSLLACYVALCRHRKVHGGAVKSVLRYLCSTLGMGLVLGGRGPIFLTGHVDASWVDDSAMQRSSQGYTFSLGSGFVSWRSTRSSLVLSSSCEAEIYAGAMVAQELRWLTYLLTDLGEQPRSPPVLYVDNKAMIALCQEHRLEHRTKHIALRYFLAQELQQRGQLRLAYVATRANTADIFTKALPPGDHQCFSTVLGLLALLFLTGLVTTCSPPLCLWGYSVPLIPPVTASMLFRNSAPPLVLFLGFQPLQHRPGFQLLVRRQARLRPNLRRQPNPALQSLPVQVICHGGDEPMECIQVHGSAQCPFLSFFIIYGHAVAPARNPMANSRSCVDLHLLQLPLQSCNLCTHVLRVPSCPSFLSGGVTVLVCMSFPSTTITGGGVWAVTPHVFLTFAGRAGWRVATVTPEMARLVKGPLRSTGDPQLILGKGYRLVVLGGYGRTDPLLKKPFYPNGLVIGILTWCQSGLGFESRCMHM
ncbi:unnamed protein product [Closterium sp. NIES-53]